jgi:hypothetical protein
MIVQIDASKQDITNLINYLNNTSEFQAISRQLEVALTEGDDSASGEVSEEGDNDIIERVE